MSSEKKIVSELTDVPSIADYLSRIGAVPRSLRVAVVREREGHYFKDVAIIRVQKDGTIEAPDVYKPTERESAQIADECTKFEWPTSIWPGQCYALPGELKTIPAENIFALNDRQGRLIMLQVRTDDPKSGGKQYRAFTFWSDQKWRNAEPEGQLPLYGLDTIKDHTTVFLHEGCKAARAVTRLIDPRTQEEIKALEAHPWGQALSGAPHLGWIGGALSPSRTDWSELAKAGVTTALIVADNDRPGKAAIKKISKELSTYPIEVFAVRFDDQFPACFDLADPFPERLFLKSEAGEKVYVGPTFSDLVRPATWATAPNPMPPANGRGRPPKVTYRLRREFIEQWFMVVGKKEPIFINRHYRTRLKTEKAFSNETRSLADCNITEMFKSVHTQKVGEIAYEPGRSEIINVDGQLCINTWVESRIPYRQNIDPAKWAFFEEYMEDLIPGAEERFEVMKWCATLIARPKVRMLYALLFWSQVQGVGKTTLCSILAELVGKENSRSPSAKGVVSSSFNGWIVRKRFISVGEIYEEGNWEAYNRLKSYITDPTIEANEKMVPTYQVSNHAHFILCSNSSTPLVIDEHDRRLFVPEITEKIKDEDWWREFHRWLTAGGYEAIRAWAENFIEAHGPVAEGARAPSTARKSQLIEDSRSPIEQKVRSLAELALSKDAVLVEGDVTGWLSEDTRSVPSKARIRTWLVAAGMFSCPQRFTIDKRSQHILLPKPMKVYGWPEIKERRMAPWDLWNEVELM